MCDHADIALQNGHKAKVLILIEIPAVQNQQEGYMKNENAISNATVEETPEQKWEKAGIGSDVIFCRVMQNKELFLKLMQRIFPELKLVEVKEHTTQKTDQILSVYDGRAVAADRYELCESAGVVCCHDRNI